MRLKTLHMTSNQGLCAEQAVHAAVHRRQRQRLFAPALPEQRTRPHIDGLALAYAHTKVLEVPDRPIRPEVLRPLLKACREGLRLETEYVSLNTPNVEVRLIAPHTLVYTGMRWHVRAYCEKNGQYRDFVLSRLRGQPDLLDESPNTRELDEDWNVEVPVILRRWAVERGAEVNHRNRLRHDDGQLVVPSRRALVKYVLQRYQIDPRNQATNPEAQQIVATNLKELRPWLMND
jgi:predicted DNA-binding transcriptional regulator YafY